MVKESGDSISFTSNHPNIFDGKHFAVVSYVLEKYFVFWLL